jgi:hypothetical protein
VVIRVLALTGQGYSLQQIADLFNREGVPTPTGRSVRYKEMVDRTAKTLSAREIAAEMVLS